MILCFFAGPAVSQACTCTNAPPGACPGLQPSDVVFLGTVTEIATVPAVQSNEGGASPADGTSESKSPTDAGTAPAANGPVATPATPVTRYHFHIDEKFAGPDSADIDVFSGGDDADCGYRFEKGAQYVVFTQQENNGELFATVCNGTRAAIDGRALLPQLRAMRDGRRIASVFGILRRADPPFLGPPDDPSGDPSGEFSNADDPLPHVALKLRSRDDRFQTSTDGHGVYSFYDMHSGQYSFTANLPARMQLTLKTLPGELPPFTIPNGACYEYDVEALPIGHIEGSVLGPGGKPLKIASVELYRVGHYDDSRPGLWGFQGAKGIFDFDHVGPGRYILVFNRTNKQDPNSPFPRAFYPGVRDLSAAKPIALKDGQDLSKVNMKVSNGYPTREIRVHVKWTGPQPAGSVTVMARAAQGDNPSVERIGEGLYQFTLLTSASYTVSAWEDLLPQHSPSRRGDPVCVIPPRIETADVSVDGADTNAKEVTLTFATPGCGK